MNKETALTGRTGEDISCKFLQKKGYKILANNYRKPWGEIDIVAVAPDKTLVFVEVKAMRSDGGSASLVPEDQMTAAKLKKFKRICESFCAANPKFVHERRGWRCDVVAVDLLPNGESAIRHYEGI